MKAKAQALIDAAQAGSEIYSRAHQIEHSYSYQCGALESIIRDLCRSLAEFESPEVELGEYEAKCGDYVVHYCINEYGSTEVVAVYANGLSIDMADLSDDLQESIKSDVHSAANKVLDSIAYDLGADSAERMAA